VARPDLWRPAAKAAFAAGFFHRYPDASAASACALPVKSASPEAPDLFDRTHFPENAPAPKMRQPEMFRS